MMAWRRGSVAALLRGGVMALWCDGVAAFAAWERGGVATRWCGGVAAWRRGGMAA